MGDNVDMLYKHRDSLTNKRQVSRWEKATGQSYDDQLYKQGREARLAELDAQKQAKETQRELDRASGKTGNTISGISSGIGQLTNMASSFMETDSDSSFEQQQAVGDALISSGNPYAAAAGAAVKVTSALDQALDINVNNINKDQAEAAGVSGFGRIANNILGFLPGTGFGALAGKTKRAYSSQDVDRVRGAYSGTTNDIDTAGTMGGKTYLFGKGKINDFIEQQNQRVNMINQINRYNTLRKQSSYGQDLAQQNQNRYSGETFQTVIGKEGMKLEDPHSIRKILSKLHSGEQIQAYQNGGSILIPEGALHKNKHHMEDVNPELAEELTSKGIPVVTTDEEGNVQQVAEIEQSEIVLEKSLTDKVEKLWKDGSDEAAIECGKLIVDTLFNNCDDNSGLIENTI